MNQLPYAQSKEFQDYLDTLPDHYCPKAKKSISKKECQGCGDYKWFNESLGECIFDDDNLSIG
jgi:hypothetical protein